MAKFKYLVRTVINQNLIAKELRADLMWVILAAVLFRVLPSPILRT
jgi:hypothetical protein